MNLILSTIPVIKDLDVFKNIESLGLKVLLPIVIVMLISGFIGMERQNVGKAAGVSAHMLVALAATGIAIFQRLFFDWQVMQNFDARPEGQRVIAQVLTGVGFIGAGVILKDTDNKIRGLTTAATIWAVSLIGVILGSGYILTGTLIGLIIVFFILFRDLKRGINPFIPIDRQKHNPKYNEDEHGHDE